MQIMFQKFCAQTLQCEQLLEEQFQQVTDQTKPFLNCVNFKI